MEDRKYIVKDLAGKWSEPISMAEIYEHARNGFLSPTSVIAPHPGGVEFTASSNPSIAAIFRQKGVPLYHPTPVTDPKQSDEPLPKFEFKDPYTAGRVAQQSAALQPPAPDMRLATWGIGISVTIMLMLTIGKCTPEDYSSDAQSFAEYYVKSRMIAPTTTKVTVTKTSQEDLHHYVVIGYVDSENAFSAMLRKEFSVKCECASSDNCKATDFFLEQ